MRILYGQGGVEWLAVSGYVQDPRAFETCRRGHRRLLDACYIKEAVRMDELSHLVNMKSCASKYAVLMTPPSAKS